MANQSRKLSAQILDEASVWFTEFTSGDMDAAAQAELIAWLRRSPEHVQGYLQIAALWDDADVLRRRAHDLDALIARAKQESNVYPLESAIRAETVASPPTRPGPLAAEKRSRQRRVWSIAASVTLVLIGATLLHLQRGIYTTDIGELRSITLDDGSSVELNARSRLKVRFSAGRRDVELLAGQALFHVEKDARRPFVVASGVTRVRAVGTAFDVYRKHGDTVVTVVEGRVAVAGPQSQSSSTNVSAQPAIPGSDNEVLLQAGEQLTVPAIAVTDAAVPSKPQRANVANATAWTEKKLVFEGVALRDVVEEFNRYNRRQLVIRDPSLNDFHVSGVFASTDSARMLEVLRRRFNVKLNQSGDEIEIVRGTDAPRAVEPSQ